MHRERERESTKCFATAVATSTLLGAVFGAVTLMGTLWRLSSKLKAHAPCNCEVGLLKQREQVSYAAVMSLNG